jgi:hypothetical protein
MALPLPRTLVLRELARPETGEHRVMNYLDVPPCITAFTKSRNLKHHELGIKLGLRNFIGENLVIDRMQDEGTEARGGSAT